MNLPFAICNPLFKDFYESWVDTNFSNESLKDVILRYETEILKIKERFNKYSHKLLEGQFYSEYFKSILKKSICSLIDYSNAHNDINCFLPECQIIKDVDSAISKTLVETELIPLERDKLLLAYIKSFIAICNNEIGQAKEMLENCIKMTNELGESYRLCLKHNLKNLSTITHIKWYSPNESYSLTDYLVDCRFW